MAFKTRQIGLHIQQHEALAIAVIRGASGWSLQRWWRLPLMNASTAEGTIPDPQSLAHVLRPRAVSCRYVTVFISFPANRTLQRAFPHPPMRLREREQVAWLSQTMARELDMDPDLLRFDFQDDALSPAFNVTAVQSKEISELLTLAQTLNVRIAAVTPDACALQRLLPFIPSGRQCLVWRDESQWLWATRYAWGVNRRAMRRRCMTLPQHYPSCRNIFRYAPRANSTWRAVTVRQPPVPPDGYRFAIALGLAMGRYADGAFCQFAPGGANIT